MVVLKTDNLKKFYGKEENQVKALNGVSFPLNRENSLPLLEPAEAESLRCYTC